MITIDAPSRAMSFQARCAERFIDANGFLPRILRGNVHSLGASADAAMTGDEAAADEASNGAGKSTDISMSGVQDVDNPMATATQDPMDLSSLTREIQILQDDVDDWTTKDQVC